ncbi:hypothetical protein XH98_11930 [Bradyrhizobium sp. CCBAU 51745]|nr:hypothetical protein [Bradyrhizobium sp. CCBAU 51745]
MSGIKRLPQVYLSRVIAEFAVGSDADCARPSCKKLRSGERSFHCGVAECDISKMRLRWSDKR